MVVTWWGGAFGKSAFTGAHAGYTETEMSNDDQADSAAARHHQVKQVIVIRRDLRMRRGKEIAQGSHAAMAFLAARLTDIRDAASTGIDLRPDARSWLTGVQAKVVLQAPDLETLLKVELAARERGLEVHVITDLGLTEFARTPTITALAIGPNRSDDIDAITGPNGLVPLTLY